jgi:hypothetical protein
LNLSEWQTKDNGWSHVDLDRLMKLMADLLRQGRFADEVMPMLEVQEKRTSV